MDHISSLKEINNQKRQPLEVECYAFLEAEGIKFPKYYYVKTKEEMEITVKLMDEYPEQKFAFKVMSPRMLHKSDFQAVKLNISKDEALTEFMELKEKFVSLGFEGVLIVPMAGEGVELLLGSTFDDTFGLICVFGIGGTYVEIFRDVTFGKSPLTREDAQLMIASIKSQELLAGPRGLPEINHMEMVDIMVKLSEISHKYRDIIKEIDINPLRVTNKGLIPLDARIIFNPATC